MSLIQRNIFPIILAAGILFSGCNASNKDKVQDDVLSASSIDISKTLLLNKIRKGSSDFLNSECATKDNDEPTKPVI